MIGRCTDGTVTNRAGYITDISVYLDVNEPSTFGKLPVKPVVGLPYPNPFNSVCQIEILLTGESDITFSVFDLLGQKIAEQNFHRKSGSYKLSFDAGDLPSGIYLYRMTIGDEQNRGKIILTR